MQQVVSSINQVDDVQVMWIINNFDAADATLRMPDDSPVSSIESRLDIATVQQRWSILSV
jgi:hypothetical protein